MGRRGKKKEEGQNHGDTTKAATAAQQTPGGSSSSSSSSTGASTHKAAAGGGGAGQQQQQAKKQQQQQVVISNGKQKHAHDDEHVDDGNEQAAGPSRRGQHGGGSRVISRRRQLLTSLIAFALGVLALYFAQRAYPEVFLLHLSSLPALSINLPPMPPISMPNISVFTDVLPSGLEIQQTIMNEINRRVLNFTTVELTTPGEDARAKNYTAKYPVIMIPGFVTTGLEVWEGEKCAQKYFRQRLWGTLTMLQTMIFQPECWAKHMSLDPATGLDPPGIRLRAAQGFEAADYLLPGLWVWAKLIQDLSLIGYDYKNLALMSYDWRLNPYDLEERDKYFTLLKTKIELMKKINGERIVLVAHSYGSNVLLMFFKWAESDQGGQGGRTWVDDHIKTFINIAGPLLGVIKAMTSYISGEMHDTAELGALENILWGRDSSVFNKKSRVQLFRTWGSLTAMLPKGGAAVWGNGTYAPEDDPEDTSPHPICVTSNEPHSGDEQGEPSPHSAGEDTCESVVQPVTQHGQAVGFSGGQVANWTVEEGIKWLVEDDPVNLGKRLKERYDFGFRVEGFEDDNPKYWTNPMSIQLPHAPNTRILCYYGVGKPTERAYIYKLDPDGKVDGLDKSVNDRSRNISDGVLMGEGDGTVTLMSLGYHCSHLWRHKTHNPGGIQVTTRELLHTDGGLMSRGPSSGDHVDIMGNAELAADILRAASGNDEDLHGEDRYYSRILELSSRVKLPKKNHPLP